MPGSRAWIPASGGLSALSETEVRGLVARLEPTVQEAQNPAAAAMIHIVQQIAGQWYDELAAIERAWEAHEIAVADEERTRKALVVVLRTLIEFVGLHARDDGALSPPDPAADGHHPEADYPIREATTHGVDPTLPVVARSAELAACLLGPFCLLRRGRPLEEWHGSKTTASCSSWSPSEGGPCPVMRSSRCSGLMPTPSPAEEMFTR